MSREREQILEMLQAGTITVDEAERLLLAIGGGPREAPQAERPEFPFGGFGPGRRRRRRGFWHSHDEEHERSAPRFVRIEIDEDTEEGTREKMRLNVPLKLLKAGINLSGLLPREARERINAKLKAKGIDVDPFALRDVEDLEAALDELDLDLDGSRIRVRVVREEEVKDRDSD